MQDGYIMSTSLVDHSLDPLLIIFVVLRRLRLVISVFLGCVLPCLLINQLLLLFFHRALEDVNAGVLGVECCVA